MLVAEKETAMMIFKLDIYGQFLLADETGLVNDHICETL